MKPHAIVLEPVGLQHRAGDRRGRAHAVAGRPRGPDAGAAGRSSDRRRPGLPRGHPRCGRSGNGHLTTFGIVAATPGSATAFIRQGAALGDTPGARQVAAFVEKPDPASPGLRRIRRVLLEQRHVPVSRIDFLAELGRLRPDILDASRAALDQAKNDLDFVRLDPAAFEACPSESIDYAVMEKAQCACRGAERACWAGHRRLVLLRREVTGKDAAVTARRRRRSAARNADLIRAESRMVAALGVDDLVVVETADVVLVAKRDQVQDVKKLVDRLKAENR